MSNILDSELRGRTPAQRPHREVVGAAVVDRELLCKVDQGIKAVAGHALLDGLGHMRYMLRIETIETFHHQTVT